MSLETKTRTGKSVALAVSRLARFWRFSRSSLKLLVIPLRLFRMVSIR